MPRSSMQWAESETRPAEDGGDDVSTTIGEIVFDAVTAHGREHAATLPEHPVEGSTAATDTVIPQPGRVTLEVHVSSAVFDLSVSTRASRRATPAGELDARTIGAVNPEDRAATVLAQIEDIIDHGTEVDFLGLPYGDLEGYQILSIAPMQDQSTGSKLVASIEARRRVTASVSEVDAPAPRVERTRPARNRGEQPATEPAEESEAAETNRSDAMAIIRAVAGSGL